MASQRIMAEKARYGIPFPPLKKEENKGEKIRTIEVRQLVTFLCQDVQLQAKIKIKDTHVVIPEKYAGKRLVVPGLLLFEYHDEVPQYSNTREHRYVYLTPEGTFGSFTALKETQHSRTTWKHAVWKLQPDKTFTQVFFDKIMGMSVEDPKFDDLEPRFLADLNFVLIAIHTVRNFRAAD